MQILAHCWSNCKFSVAVISIEMAGKDEYSLMIASSQHARAEGFGPSIKTSRICLLLTTGTESWDHTPIEEDSVTAVFLPSPNQLFTIFCPKEFQQGILPGWERLIRSTSWAPNGQRFAIEWKFQAADDDDETEAWVQPDMHHAVSLHCASNGACINATKLGSREGESGSCDLKWDSRSSCLTCTTPLGLAHVMDAEIIALVPV